MALAGLGGGVGAGFGMDHAMAMSGQGSSHAIGTGSSQRASHVSTFVDVESHVSDCELTTSITDDADKKDVAGVLPVVVQCWAFVT